MIKGEVKEKLYGIIADSIDVMRLYESALQMWKATKDELAALIEENDRLRDGNEVHQEAAEKAYGQVAALEHTVSELEQRNDCLLRMEKDETARLIEEADDLKEENAKLRDRCDMLDRFRDLNHSACAHTEKDKTVLEHKLFAHEAELEKYRLALRLLWGMVKSDVTQSLVLSMQARLTDRMRKEGYDIESEEHAIEGFGSFGCEDSSEGADEHDFL